MLFFRLLAPRPEIQIVDRTGGEMRLLDVGISQLAVPAGHFQVGMPQQPLQGEHIAAVSQEGDGSRVAQRVRRASDPRSPAFLPFLLMISSTHRLVNGRPSSVRKRKSPLGLAGTGRQWLI
jgi:hypothetical protein